MLHKEAVQCLTGGKVSVQSSQVGFFPVGSNQQIVHRPSSALRYGWKAWAVVRLRACNMAGAYAAWPSP